MESPIPGPQTWGTPASEAPVVDKARIMDKAWEQVQKKTFTKWVNTKLRERQLSIEDLTQDLDDGVMLIHLLEIIGNAEVGRYYKAPKMRIQKIENCNMALAFIKKRGVNLTNIGAEDIVDAKEKLILGMIWTIILRFTIADIREEGQNSKDGLLLWCQRRTQGYAPDVNVRDFHNSWNDGLAFCALIHRHRPDLLDFHELDKTNSQWNCNLAFEVAERDLGIPKLLDVEDVVDLPKPDERSLMTYVAQFFHTFSSSEKLETAGRRVAKFAEVVQSVFEMRNDYERRARQLMDDISALQMEWDYATFDGTYADAKGQSNAFVEYKKNTKRSWVSEKRELENMLGNIQTKLKMYNLTPYNPPEGYKPVDVEQAWQRLISREVRRKRDIRAKITEIKQALQDEFSQLANSLAKKLDKITLQHADIDADGELEDQLNIYRSALEHVENLESVELIQVVESELRCLEANIEEVEDTVYTADDLAFEIAQAKQSLQKKCNFLENQIVARGISNLQPELLEEFEAAFRHFAKETTNSLTKSEFMSCLQALGVSLADEEFEQVFSQLSSNKVFVNFEQFTNYMVSITEDRTTSDQLRSAFQDLATNKVNTIAATNSHFSVESQQLSLPGYRGLHPKGASLLSVEDIQRSFSDLQSQCDKELTTQEDCFDKEAQDHDKHSDRPQFEHGIEICRIGKANPTLPKPNDLQAEKYMVGEYEPSHTKNQNSEQENLLKDSERHPKIKPPVPVAYTKPEFSDRVLERTPPVRQRARSLSCSEEQGSNAFRRQAFSDRVFGKVPAVRQRAQSFIGSGRDESIVCRQRTFSDRVFSRSPGVRQRAQSFTLSENHIAKLLRLQAFSDQVFKRAAPVRQRALSFSAGDKQISMSPKVFSDQVFREVAPVRQRAQSFTCGIRDPPGISWRISDPIPFGRLSPNRNIIKRVACDLPSRKPAKPPTKVFDQEYFARAFQALRKQEINGKLRVGMDLKCEDPVEESPPVPPVPPDKAQEMPPKVDSSLNPQSRRLEKSTPKAKIDSIRVPVTNDIPPSPKNSDISPLPQRLIGTKRRPIAAPSRGHLLLDAEGPSENHQLIPNSDGHHLNDNKRTAIVSINGGEETHRAKSPQTPVSISEHKKISIASSATSPQILVPSKQELSKSLRPSTKLRVAESHHVNRQEPPLQPKKTPNQCPNAHQNTRSQPKDVQSKARHEDSPILKMELSSNQQKPHLNVDTPVKTLKPVPSTFPETIPRRDLLIRSLSRGEEAFLSYLVLIILLIGCILSMGVRRSVAIATVLAVVGVSVYSKPRSRGARASSIPRPLDLSGNQAIH